jgi:polar amino acid transport system permease protein
MKVLKIFLADKLKRTTPAKAAFNMLIAVAAVIALFWYSLAKIGIRLDFSFFLNFRIRVFSGFAMTLELAAASLGLSLLLGILSVAGHNCRFLPLRYLCGIYVRFIRGTPLITQIYLFFYIVGTAWGVNNRFVAGMIILSLFEGAYISEIIRGSLLSMDASQLEAARAVGFTRAQTLFNVTLPQLVARTLPALTGQFASIIKDSSLLSVIAVTELTQSMKEISATNFRLFECYLFLGLLYLCLTLPVAFATKRLERRFDYEN